MSAASVPTRLRPANSIVPRVIVPRCARSVPESARSSVVLPAPLLPSTAVTAAVGTSSETPRSAWTGARVAHVQVVDGQRGGHDRDLSSNSRHTSLLGGFGLSRGNVSGALM